MYNFIPGPSILCNGVSKFPPTTVTCAIFDRVDAISIPINELPITTTFGIVVKEETSLLIACESASVLRVKILSNPDPGLSRVLALMS